MELNSLTQQSECAGAESRCLRILSECLGDSSMRLGVPFIAPRQLGAVEDQLGRPILHSVEWCTGQFGAPPDSPVHPDCAESWLLQPSLFPFVFSLILALRQIYQYIKTMYIVQNHTFLLICTSFIIWHIITHFNMCWTLNHQNILEMAQGHTSLSIISAHYQKRGISTF